MHVFTEIIWGRMYGLTLKQGQPLEIREQELSSHQAIGICISIRMHVSTTLQSSTTHFLSMTQTAEMNAMLRLTGLSDTSPAQVSHYRSCGSSKFSKSLQSHKYRRNMSSFIAESAASYSLDTPLELGTNSNTKCTEILNECVLEFVEVVQTLIAIKWRTFCVKFQYEKNVAPLLFLFWAAPDSSLRRASIELVVIITMLFSKGVSPLLQILQS